jgi:antitoxin CptB
MSLRSFLAWRCRRGTRELDLLLQAYLERAYDSAGAQERSSFAGLLQRSDEDLRRLLFGKPDEREPALAVLIGQIHAAAAHHAEAFRNT